MSGRAKRASTQKKEVEPEAKKKHAGLAIGDELPSFELENDEGETVASKDLVADNGIVLFAYPKANTKGCTSQAVGLSEKIDELAAAGYKVYGISADKPKSQAAWRKKESLKMHLLCDPSFEVLAKLGFQKGAKSINRSHIVVAKGGKVADVQYGITPKNSVKDAVAFCLAHKGDALAPAADEEEKEEAEEAGEEAAKAGEKAEQEEEAAAMETDEKEADKAEEPKADEAKEDEEEAAADKAEEPAKEEAGEEKAGETEAAAEAAPEEAAVEPPAEEAPAAAAAAAEDKPAAEEEKPAAEGEAAADKPAAEEAAA